MTLAPEVELCRKNLLENEIAIVLFCLAQGIPKRLEKMALETFFEGYAIRFHNYNLSFYNSQLYEGCEN